MLAVQEAISEHVGGVSTDLFQVAQQCNNVSGAGITRLL